MRYGDLHSDTLTLARSGARSFLHKTSSHVSLEKLVGGECFLQCFALFSRSCERGAWERALGFLSDFAAAEDELLSAGIMPVLTIEDGGILENDLSRLDILTKAGVKMFGFTWNDENCLGFPNGRAGGLKSFGYTVAEALIARGVYIDVSHLNDEGFSDLAELTKSRFAPLIASHSLARSVCPHSRNLTDEQIRGIADSGGVIGVCFVRDFIGKQGIFAHIRHIGNVGGEDVLAIGSDFDGTEAPIYAGADEMPKFFDDMKKVGFSERLTEKIAYKNIEKLFVKRGKV